MKTSSRIAVFALAVILVWGATARAAEWKTFRIVLVPERNIFEQQRRYQTLCDYVCSMLPMEFTFEVLKEYQNVLLELKEGRADGAIMGSFVATYGIDNFGFVPLLRPVWPSGESHYSSYIFKRAGTPVTRDVSTWKGHSFVFVGPNTSAGYYFPLGLLRRNGVKEIDEFFSSVRFVESHDTAVWMVANDIAQIGAAKNTVYNEFTKRKPEIGEKVEILYNGGRYPDSTLVVRGDVPHEIRESIRSVFLTMNSRQAGIEILKMYGALKFVPTTPEDFDDVRKIVRESGNDIATITIADPSAENAE